MKRSGSRFRYKDRFLLVNILRPRQNVRQFSDDIFKCIFLNENVSISIKISLKFVSNGPISNIPALIQKMAWRRPYDKPISELMLVSLLTHKCVIRPQWVNHERWAFVLATFVTVSSFWSVLTKIVSGDAECVKLVGNKNYIDRFGQVLQHRLNVILPRS